MSVCCFLTPVYIVLFVYVVLFIRCIDNMDLGAGFEIPGCGRVPLRGDLSLSAARPGCKRTYWEPNLLYPAVDALTTLDENFASKVLPPFLFTLHIHFGQSQTL